MNLSVSGLAAGFVFGVFGFSVFKMGRKRQKVVPTLVGIVLMIYPYFIENDYLLWGIGAVLLAIGVKSL